MKKTNCTETQIIKRMKEVEGGRLVKEVCREFGISGASYYHWKVRYGDMEASVVKRTTTVKEENWRKKHVAASRQERIPQLGRGAASRTVGGESLLVDGLHERQPVLWS